MASRPVRLFISYAREDEAYRIELEKRLKQLQREGLIETWHDRKLLGGDEWKQQIDQQLQEADVILLLISPDFLHSDYCYDIEMKRAVERHDQGKARVIPIILRLEEWHRAPFGKLQALPQDGKAVATWQDRDEAWLSVVRGIRRTIDEINKGQDEIAVKYELLVSKHNELLEELEKLKNKHKKQEKTEASLSEKLSQAQEQAGNMAKAVVLAKNLHMRLEEDFRVIEYKLVEEKKKVTKLQDELAVERGARANLQQELSKAKDQHNEILKAQRAEEQGYQLTRFRDEMIDELNNEEIGSLLNLSEKTVRSYRSQPDRLYELIYRIRSDESTRLKALQIVTERRRQKTS